MRPPGLPLSPQAPEKYVELDGEMAQVLLDQKDSGKQLLLITNSDYQYTDKMMSFAYNRFLPNVGQGGGLSQRVEGG